MIPYERRSPSPHYPTWLGHFTTRRFWHNHLQVNICSQQHLHSHSSTSSDPWRRLITLHTNTPLTQLSSSQHFHSTTTSQPLFDVFRSLASSNHSPIQHSWHRDDPIRKTLVVTALSDLTGPLQTGGWRTAIISCKVSLDACNMHKCPRWHVTIYWECSWGVWTCESRMRATGRLATARVRPSPKTTSQFLYLDFSQWVLIVVAFPTQTDWTNSPKFSSLFGGFINCSVVYLHGWNDCSFASQVLSSLPKTPVLWYLSVYHNFNCRKHILKQSKPILILIIHENS